MSSDRDAYRVLFDANPLPMFVSDRETLQILMVNRAACEHYGWSEAELLAMTIRDIRPPEEIRAFEAAFAATKASGTYSRAGRHHTKDGRIIDVTLEITQIMLGDRPASLAVITDVTGVAQAERRFRLLVEHSADGIVVTNEHHVVEYVSPAGQRILGSRPDEVVGKSAANRTHPDDTGRWSAPAPGETRTSVARVSHRDGSWRWIESTTTNLIHDPAVRALVSNFRDITERKVSEEALVESQRRLQYLLSATAAVTYTARASGDFGATFISSNVHAVLGYEPSEFLDNPSLWIDNIHPEDRPAVEADIAKLLEDGEKGFTYRFRDKAGTYRWMRDSARIVRDANGKPVEAVGFWVDVTDQVRAEQALRRSEVNFRALIERAPVATFVHRDGVYVYVNPAAAAVLGYQSADDLVGRLVLDSIHPADRDGIRARMTHLSKHGSTPPNIARMLKADGSSVMIEAEGMLLDFDGQPSSVIMGRDVSERHEMFARMAMADRMLTVGSLAAGVAHEINNPLVYIGTNLEMLASQLPNLLEGRPSRLNATDVHSLVADARDGVAKVSTIVRDLRSLSRPDDESNGPVDVVAVLASSIKMAHNEIRHHARVVESYEDRLPLVVADASRLGQVFLNLLLNAAQAMADGRADHNELRVRAGVTADGSAVRVEIEDTGTGIPASILPRIFDPFFTTKAPGVGTGLGLSISHQIVRSMDGEIDVDSRPGQGCTFRVTLPIASAIATPCVPERAPELAARVLLIDDEAAVGRSLVMLLAPENDVIAVTRAEDALARLADGERFDAIVCDLMMPDINGIELYARISRVAPDYASRIIFMTGGAFTPQAREFLASLDRPHLEKPFTEVELRRAIESVARPTSPSPA